MPTGYNSDSETEEILKAAAAETEHDDDGSDVERNNDEAGEEKNPTPTKKKSSYKGVNFDTREAKFVARVQDGPVRRNMGTFVLECDAAFAVDELKKVLQGPGCKTNFPSFETYRQARALEARTARDAPSIDKIFSKVQARIAAIQNFSSQTEELKQVIRTRKKAGKGVQYNKAQSKFKAMVAQNRKKYYMGSYHLEADAALAADQLAQSLEFTWNDNFDSIESYAQARELEIEQKGVSAEDAGSMADTMSEIQKRIDQIKSDILSAEASVKSSGQYLSSEPRKRKNSNYRCVSYDATKKRYRSNINICNKKFNIGDWCLESDAAYSVDRMSDVFGVQARGRNFGSHDMYQQARAMELESVTPSDKQNAVDDVEKKIQARIANIKSTLTTSGISIRNATKSHGGTKLNAMTKHDLTPLDDPVHLPFPKGCSVMTDLRSDSPYNEIIKKGNTITISGAFIDIQSREIFYSANYKDHESDGPMLFSENELAFAIGSSIKYSPQKRFEMGVEGQILLLQSKLKHPPPGRPSKVTESNDALDLPSKIYYTIIIFHNGPKGKFEVIDDVPGDQIKLIMEENDLTEMQDENDSIEQQGE